MANSPLSCEPNVQMGIFAAFVSHIILQVCAHYGIDVDKETAEDLPTVLILAGTYLPDVLQKWRSQKSCDSKPAA